MTIIHRAVTEALDAISDEYRDTRKSIRPARSAYEGYARLLAEVEDLWREVKNNPAAAEPEWLVRAAKQVAAMALAIMVEIEGFDQ